MSSKALRIEPPLSADPSFLTLHPPYNECAAELDLINSFQHPLLIKVKSSDKKQLLVSEEMLLLDAGMRKKIKIKGRFVDYPPNCNLQVKYKTAPAGTITDLKSAWKDSTSLRQEFRVPISFEEYQSKTATTGDKDDKKERIL